MHEALFALRIQLCEISPVKLNLQWSLLRAINPCKRRVCQSLSMCVSQLISLLLARPAAVVRGLRRQRIATKIMKMSVTVSVCCGVDVCVCVSQSSRLLFGAACFCRART